jgi:hypothetical protein
MKAALLLVVVTLGVAAPSSASTHWTWRSLHRPLHIPRIEPGAACPLSALTAVDLGANGVRSLPGRGPAYPTLNRGSTLEFFYPPLPSSPDFYGTDWGGQKVLWWVDRSYRGPVLIRGRQLDGPNLVRFDRGRPAPPAEMRIQPGARAQLRDRASFTRLRSAGCYAYQIDGTTFSRVIVFQAQIIPPPG